jgi:Fic/DOC family protein
MAYLFHVCQNHPFIDGNKRAGANAAVTFLLMNDWEPTFEEEELVEVVLAVASGRLSKQRLIEIFESRCKPSENTCICRRNVEPETEEVESYCPESIEPYGGMIHGRLAFRICGIAAVFSVIERHSNIQIESYPPEIFCTMTGRYRWGSS